jgi:hypothetical protein
MQLLFNSSDCLLDEAQYPSRHHGFAGDIQGKMFSEEDYVQVACLARPTPGEEARESGLGVAPA